MKKMFISNLPSEISEEAVEKLFAEFGTVRSIQLATDVFTRRCRGFGFVEMEGHEARAAIAALDGKSYDGKFLRVRFDESDNRRGGSRRR